MQLSLDILVLDDNPIDLAFFLRAADKTGLAFRLQTLTVAEQAIGHVTAKGYSTILGTMNKPLACAGALTNASC